MARKSPFELRQIDCFVRRQSIALDELIKLRVICFLVEKVLQEIYKFESWADNFNSKVHIETKNSTIRKWIQIYHLNLRSSPIANEIRAYPLLLSK